MAVSVVEIQMLYCPKCNSTYEEGTQRFCTNDGRRLLPAPPPFKSAAGSKSIFKTIIEDTFPTRADDAESASAPRVFVAPLQSEKSEFHSAFSSKVFEDKFPPPEKDEPPPFKSTIRLVKPSEVPSGTAAVGDRTLHPAGRTALTWENPKVLIGQTIKGRYFITDEISRDDTSFTYLAEDKIIADKEVVVRVLMDETKDDFLDRIFAEERISLSHINHPHVAKVFDSGELLEGKPFIVTEMVDGFSVREKLGILDKYEPLRAAKIIRQASYALSEVHQHGILHRNLKPENIFLTISETGAEQVKVTDFAVSGAINRRNSESLKYLAPEQIEGKLPNFASDIYSLAVIAYEMLTGHYPFEFSSAEQMLKAQKKYSYQKASELSDNLSANVDEILDKALTSSPSDRYPKARDFGDALFNALTATVENTIVSDDKTDVFAPDNQLLQIPDKETAAPPKLKTEENPAEKSAPFKNVKTETLLPAVSRESELAREKRSPETVKTADNSWFWIAAIGLLLALLATWAIWHYVLTSSTSPESTANQTEISTRTAEQAKLAAEANAAQKSSSAPSEIEPPPPRMILPPPDTEYFQNSKAKLNGDLLRNYRGFTLYYPKSWQRNADSTNFIDISKKAESGTPIEQFLVSYYESRGTAKLDGEQFPKLVQDSNKKLSQIVTNYRLLSEGEKTINNGWKGYEMKFEGAGVTAGGEKINLWGRRLFIPAARRDAKSGFVITMLATSLSPDVKNADDVGIKGESANILETFEPAAAE